MTGTKPSVCFFTVVHYKDYDFLLGAIEHHAEMGKHLVLDTSPMEHAKRFRKLPSSVLWINAPFYGSGWREFQLRTAVVDAMRSARLLGCEVLVYLDSDEFYAKESVDNLFPWAKEAMVEIQYVHWKRDGHAYTFGPSEWHCRLWPSDADVRIAENQAWKKHPKYNGNSEHHPVPVQPVGLPVIRVYGPFRHHLHYALGPKALDEETAENTIDGWPNGDQVSAPPLPEKLLAWKEKGVLPSEAFL
jgi:hypothetical protein